MESQINIPGDADIFQCEYVTEAGRLVKEVPGHKAYTEFSIPIPENIKECESELEFKVYEVYKILNKNIQEIADRYGKNFEIDPIIYRLIDK